MDSANANMNTRMDEADDINLDEWEQIPSPTTRQYDNDVIALRETYLQHTLSLFPPTLHNQDTPVLSPQQQQQPNSPSSSSSTSSSSSDEDNIGGRLNLLFSNLGSGIVRIVTKLPNSAVYVGGSWSFAAMTGLVATVLLTVLYARVRRWRRRLRSLDQSNRRLILILTEKDQVALLNSYSVSLKRGCVNNC